MVDIFSELTTLELIEVVERIKQPAKFILDALFPNVQQITQEALPLEYSKQQRRLAPYIEAASKVTGGGSAQIKALISDQLKSGAEGVQGNYLAPTEAEKKRARINAIADIANSMI